MAYLVYEYPDGYGCISATEISKNDYILHKKCSSIKEAKETLKDVITKNVINGKIKRR